MAVRNHRKHLKGLDESDPFDQLIIEMAQNGFLDVSTVEIPEEPPETEEYSKSLLSHRKKNTSS
jgi:hypothetical protein